VQFPGGRPALGHPAFSIDPCCKRNIGSVVEILVCLTEHADFLSRFKSSKSALSNTLIMDGPRPRLHRTVYALGGRMLESLTMWSATIIQRFAFQIMPQSGLTHAA
jgi:hypothetical protein